MKMVRRLLQLLYVVYAGLLFVALMVPVFLVAIIALPLGRIRGGNLIYRVCSVWADIWLLLAGILHRNIYEEAPGESEPCIYVANHISYLDAAIIVKMVRKPLRPLGKASLGKIPLFGFIYRMAVVTVDRSSPENRARSVSILKAILRKGISILVFPEGTFNETHQPLTDFFDGAFRIAIETGMPIQPIILPDSYARMPYDQKLSLNPGKSRAVFLKSFSTEGMDDEDIPVLRDNVHAYMSEKLREYGASWIR